VAGLLRSGLSDDEMFEVTVSAALGAGLVRLEAALGALCREYSAGAQPASNKGMRPMPLTSPLTHVE
jgi:hypothetical protein